MKNILVISYSQSGQLNQILDNFLIPFKGHNIERVHVTTVDKYPFPWTSEVFFNVMPECVLEKPTLLEPFTLKREKYDLIIIGYQPWFLSPAQPTTSLFKTPQFKKILKDTNVATVIGARNMWLNSQESIVKWIDEAGGKLVANIPFIDKVQNHISALTILHWMSTGTKTRRWGFLPLPGVSERDINDAGRFGTPLAKALEQENYKGVQKNILSSGSIQIKPSIILIESRAKKLFTVWANMITKKGTTPKKRVFWSKLFKWYLIIALFVVSPPVIFIHNLLRPFLWSKIKKNQHKYLFLGIED